MPALRLIKFVVKTRLSGDALALLLFVALVVLMTGLSMTFSKARSPPTLGFTEFLRGYMTFMLAILMLTPLPAGAQMSVLKSNRDYLFTLPVRPRDLSLALYIAYMLLSGVYTLAFIGVYELLLGVPPLLSVVFGMFTVPLLSALGIGGPMLSLYVSIAFLVAALPFMLTRGPWRRAALNLVEGGYS